MKKVLAILLSVFILICSAPPVMAADDTLDIEKAAIATRKHSQALQNVDKQVDLAKKNYANATEKVNTLRGILPNAKLMGLDPYQIVEAIILLPLQQKNMVDLYSNGQQVAANGVRLTAYQAYIQLLKDKYAMDIQQDLMLNLETDYKNAQIQQAQGSLSSAQLRLNEITYLKAQYAYHNTQNSYDSSTQALNQMMGEDLGKRYSSLQDYNIVPAPTIQPLPDYVHTALANRVEIINAQNTLDMQKKAYDLGRASIPTDYDFWTQKQEYNIDKAQNDLDLAKINVQEDITNFYKNLDAAMKNLEAQKALADQAVLNYQAAEAQYKNSQITLLDLDNAKIAKAKADTAYKKAQLDAWLAQTTMNEACGAGYVPKFPSPPENFSFSPYPSKNNSNPVDSRD